MIAGTGPGESFTMAKVQSGLDTTRVRERCERRGLSGRGAGRALVSVAVGAFAALAACSGGGGGGGDIGRFESFARAERITDRNQLIGGPAAIANLGDFILEYRSPRGLADLAAGLIDAAIPKQASDAQVDEVLRRGKLEMAQVFEVSEPPPEELDEGGEDDFEHELYYGPSPAA